MFGAGYDAGTLLDPPEASQRRLPRLWVTIVTHCLPLWRRLEQRRRQNRKRWWAGEIDQNPEKLGQARRIQPGASVPDLEGWGALKPGKKQLLSVMCERLITEEVNRGRPAPSQCDLPRRFTSGSWNEPHPVWLRPQCLTQRSSLLLASHHQGSHSPPVESPPGLRPTVLAVVPPAACRAARSWAHMASPQTRWQRVEVRKPHLGMGCVG